jgi:hypothetical protein
MNYANILCNIAVGRSLLAADQYVQKDVTKSEVIEASSLTPKQYEEQESDQIKKNMDILSSAVKALETHIADTTDNATDEVNSNLKTNGVIIAPVLGRALGLMGKLYLNPFRYGDRQIER